MNTFFSFIKTDFTRYYGVVLTVCIIGAILINFLLSKIFTSLSKKFITTDTNNIIKLVRRPTLLFSILVSIKLLIELSEFDGRIMTILTQSTTVLVIICTTWLAIRILKVAKIIVFEKIEASVVDTDKLQKTKTQIEILEKIIVFFLVTLSIFGVLMSFEFVRRVGVSFFASAGVAGIIVGLAAQKLITTIISGIQVAIAQPIRINDAVIVENEWGVVEEINLTYVVVRLWDLRRMVLPTTYFIDKPFQNWTRESPQLVAHIFLYLDYSIPVEDIRKEFMRLLKGNELWDKEISAIHVSNTTDKTIELRGIFSVHDAGDAWDLKAYMRENLISYIQKKYPDGLPKLRLEK